MKALNSNMIGTHNTHKIDNLKLKFTRSTQHTSQVYKTTSNLPKDKCTNAHKIICKNIKNIKKIKHPTPNGHVIKEATITCGQLTFIIVKEKNGYMMKNLTCMR